MHSVHCDHTRVPEHKVPAHLLLGFGGFRPLAKDAVEVCFSAGGQVLAWMEGREEKKKEKKRKASSFHSYSLPARENTALF